MKVLIIGAGETGYFIAQGLSEESGIEVVLVDSKRQHVENLQRSLNIAGVVGNGTSLRVLEQAGIESCDILIACTDHDETNLICCLVANHYKVPYKIAVTRTDSFLKRKTVQRYMEGGVSQVINTSVLTAQEVIATATYASATAVSVFGERNVLLIGYKMREDSPWKDKMMFEIRSAHANQDFLIASIVRDGESFLPTGRDQVLEGDYVYILAPKKGVEALDDMLHTKVAHNRRAVVAGSGYIAQRVALGLIHSHFQVTMICDDPVGYHQLKEKFSHHKGFHLLQGELSNVKLQLKQEVSTAALFVAVGKLDESNIAAALVAKYLGAVKTIAVVNRQDLVEPARLLDIDVILSPRLSTARAVKKVIQGDTSSKLNFTTISETDMEVREMIVSEKSPLARKALKEIKIPKGILIGALVQESGEVLIPKGDTVIHAGDRVIVVTLPETAPKLKELVDP